MLFRSGFEGGAQVERLFVEGLGVAAPLLVRAVDQERLLQQVGGQQGAPAGAHEGFRKAPQPVVGVAAAGALRQPDARRPWS